MCTTVNKTLCCVKNKDEHKFAINLSEDSKSPRCSVVSFDVRRCFMDDYVVCSLRKSLRKENSHVLDNTHVDNCCNDYCDDSKL